MQKNILFEGSYTFHDLTMSSIRIAKDTLFKNRNKTIMLKARKSSKYKPPEPSKVNK